MSKPANAGSAHFRWFGRPAVIIAWLGLGLAAMSPPHGTGLTVCWFKACTSLPCPGCGMTRSLSCALRGMFAESWSYHPLGVPVMVLFLLTVAFSLLPEGWRKRVTLGIESRARLFNGVYFACVALFVGYGLARALVEAGHLFLSGI